MVETIDFYADEDAELPPPMSQRDVILLNKAQQLEDEEEEEAAAAEGEASKQKVSSSPLAKRRSEPLLLPTGAHSLFFPILVQSVSCVMAYWPCMPGEWAWHAGWAH